MRGDGAVRAPEKSALAATLRGAVKTRMPMAGSDFLREYPQYFSAAFNHYLSNDTSMAKLYIVIPAQVLPWGHPRCIRSKRNCRT